MRKMQMNALLIQTLTLPRDIITSKQRFILKNLTLI